MKNKSTVIAVALVIALSATLVAAYLISTAAEKQTYNSQARNMQAVIDEQNSPRGLDPDIRFASYPFTSTVEASQQRITLFDTKLPLQSTLPSGYQPVGAASEPDGPEVKDPDSGRTFRPQSITIYYWNKALDPNMRVDDFYDQGGIFIDEAYAVGVNTTRGYLADVDKLPPGVTVGWFKGHPGIWSNGYAEVFQFDKNMSYLVKGKFLTQEQALTIVETLLKQ